VTLPKQIRFGTYVAKIVYEKLSRDHDYYATNINKQQLTIFTEYPIETVKYEFFEGILALLIGYLIKITVDGKFCHEAFCRVLYSVLRQNPDLIKRKINESIIILGKRFDICYQSQLHSPNITGEIDYSFSKIFFQEGMADRQMFAVFWHEVIHEIFHVIDESFNKEDLVHQLAILVSELLYGNDLSWIFEDKKDDSPKVD